eukprot:5349361-Pyramimonas_sp.AAC.1
MAQRAATGTECQACKTVFSKREQLVRRLRHTCRHCLVEIARRGELADHVAAARGRQLDLETAR